MTLNPLNFDWVKKLTGEPEKDSGISLLSTPETPVDDYAKYSDFLTMEDLAKQTNASPYMTDMLSSGSANSMDSYDFSTTMQAQNSQASLSAMIQQTANSYPHNGSGILGGLAGAANSGISSGLGSANMAPLTVNADAMWEKKLKELEVDIQSAILANAPQSQIAYMKAELNAKKQSYLKTQIEQEQKSTQKIKLWTPGKVIPVQGTQEVKTGLGYSIKYAVSGAPSTTAKVDEFDAQTPRMDEQKFIMRIGIASNANVSVQSKSQMYTNKKAYRLRCDFCKETTGEVENKIIENHMHDHSIITDFCKLHRHTTEVVAPAEKEGRKFRDG